MTKQANFPELQSSHRNEGVLKKKSPEPINSGTTPWGMVFFSAHDLNRSASPWARPEHPPLLTKASAAMRADRHPPASFQEKGISPGFIDQFTKVLESFGEFLCVHFGEICSWMSSVIRGVPYLLKIAV